MMWGLLLPLNCALSEPHSNNWATIINAGPGRLPEYFCRQTEYGVYFCTIIGCLMKYIDVIDTKGRYECCVSSSFGNATSISAITFIGASKILRTRLTSEVGTIITLINVLAGVGRLAVVRVTITGTIAVVARGTVCKCGEC